jgi:O-antigen ligase
MEMNKQFAILICDKVMEYALYLMVFYLPISKAIIEIALILAIVAFFIKKIITRQFLPLTTLNNYLFFYLLICAVSIIFSTNIPLSFKALFLKLGKNVLAYFVLIEVITDKKKIRNIITVFLLSATLVCIDGFFQYFTHVDFLRHRKWPYDLKPFTFRITGPFLTKNDFAAYLLPLTVISVGLYFAKTKNLVVKYFLKVLPIALLFCLFLTLSRGALIAAFAGFCFLGIFVSGKKLLISLFLIILMLCAFFWHLLPLEKKSEFSFGINISDAGSRDRKVLNRISLDMWKEKPIFGQGLGTYMYNFEKFNYDKKAYPWGPSYAHNCYLQMLSEIGIVGLASFLLLITALFYKSIKRISRIADNFDLTLSIALLAALCAYLINSAFDTNLYSVDLGRLFWLLLALSQSQLKLSEYSS